MTKGIDASRTSDCENAMDVTGKDQLGDCVDFNFSPSSARGIVSSNGSADGWRGEWIRVVLSDHANLECPRENWIEADNSDSLEFNCAGEYYSKIRIGFVQ